MLLGLHNYSFYLHGLGGHWKGFRPPWPRQMDIFQLIQRCRTLGLDGLHLDAAALNGIADAHLADVKAAVRENGLYIEFNWGMPKQGPDPRLQFELPEGIAIARKLGADVGKISLNLTRPHPLTAGAHHPDVMTQLKTIAAKITSVLGQAEQAGVRLALENHTDAFSTEILWLLEKIHSPWVGACLDTVNPMMVGENPLDAIRNLAPHAISNHFRDSKIVQTRYGCKIVGTALGQGDIDLRYAYDALAQNPGVQRINIEVALDAPVDDMAQALATEQQAVAESVAYCRSVLNIVRKGTPSRPPGVNAVVSHEPLR